MRHFLYKLLATSLLALLIIGMVTYPTIVIGITMAVCTVALSMVLGILLEQIADNIKEKLSK